MEKLIEILKSQLKEVGITDIIQSGANELDLVVSSNANFREFRRMGELIHADSEVQIKGVKINYVDEYGSPLK